MANPGLFIALCAALLAVDDSAQPAPEAGTPSAQPCRFTLERDAAPAADDETWVLTCHRATASVPSQPVVQRKPFKAPTDLPAM